MIKLTLELDKEIRKSCELDLRVIKKIRKAPYPTLESLILLEKIIRGVE